MIQNLYIPEIGDQMILVEDWTFMLHPESRNADLGKFFGYYQYNWKSGWIPEAILPKMRDIDYTIKYPDENEPRFRAGMFGGRFDHDKYREAVNEAVQSNPAVVQYHKDQAVWNEKVKDVIIEDLMVTIPKGTIIQVDRIYIRKGSSDYSSVTFYAKNLGEIESTYSSYNAKPKKKIKKKALRFWAKLSDCNKIVFSTDLENPNLK